MTNKPLTQIATITAAHGIRGWVKIRSFANPPEAIFKCPLFDASGKRSFSLKRMGGGARALLASVDGITDRNAAELLKGTELFSPASVSTKESDNLVGVTAKLANGTTYGEITGVYNFGAGDIIEIALEGGKTEMLPLNKEFVETGKGFVIIHPPEYVEGDDE